MWWVILRFETGGDHASTVSQCRNARTGDLAWQGAGTRHRPRRTALSAAPPGRRRLLVPVEAPASVSRDSCGQIRSQATHGKGIREVQEEVGATLVRARACKLNWARGRTQLRQQWMGVA